MRAHVHRAAPLALLYRLPAGTQAGWEVRAQLRAMGAEARDISPGELSCPLEALARPGAASRTRPRREAAAATAVASHGEAPPGEAPPAEPMLVLCRFSDAQLDSLLAALRAAGASIPLKAVLTEHNRAWDARTLHAQLRREHAAMAARPRDGAQGGGGAR